jgi:hypothetical protein
MDKSPRDGVASNHRPLRVCAKPTRQWSARGADGMLLLANVELVFSCKKPVVCLLITNPYPHGSGCIVKFGKALSFLYAFRTLSSTYHLFTLGHYWLTHIEMRWF